MGDTRMANVPARGYCFVAPVARAAGSAHTRIHEGTAHPNAEALRAAVDEERTIEVLNPQPLHHPTVSSHKPEQRRGSRR